MKKLSEIGHKCTIPTYGYGGEIYEGDVRTARTKAEDLEFARAMWVKALETHGEYLKEYQQQFEEFCKEQGL